MEIAEAPKGVVAPSIDDFKPARVFVITSNPEWRSSPEVAFFAKYVGACEFTDALAELDSCQVAIVVPPFPESAKPAFDYFYSRHEPLVYRWSEGRNTFVLETC